MGKEYYWWAAFKLRGKMKRVVFIVEGDTEISFIQKRVIPYLYSKDGEMILEALEINDIRDKCPRFNKWMEKLEEGLKNDHF